MRYRDGNTPFESSRRQYATGPTTAAPGASRVTAVSISELNNATKALVEGSFGRFWVRGEVSDFKPHRNGHWYFCLRDSAAQMACVVWNSDQRAIPALPDDGMQVVALAQMTLFPARGSLQLRITRIEAAGDGLWRKAMQLTVKRLTAEGLLADERKRPMPRFPRCIAVVTSTSGAALKDITSVARRRRPGIRIIISAAAVQGESAPLEICAAIARVVRWGGADVVIVGRGGGSREDLWAFNDERVARAVASCPVPVISAVGHEIDITVCDLVADLRAATPSAAAETAIPALDDLMAAIRARRSRLRSAVSERMRAASLDIRTAAKNMRAASIRATERRRAHVATTAGRLNALSPLATLERGYAVARSVSGETLSSVEQFEGGMAFELMLRDGFIAASVDRVRLNPDGTNGQ